MIRGKFPSSSHDFIIRSLLFTHLFLVGLILALFMISLTHEVFRGHHALPWLPPKFFFLRQGFYTGHTHHVISSPTLKMLAAMNMQKNLFTSISNQGKERLNSELLGHAKIPERNFLPGPMKTEPNLVNGGTDKSHLNTLGKSVSKRLTSLVLILWHCNRKEMERGSIFN